MSFSHKARYYCRGQLSPEYTCSGYNNEPELENYYFGTKRNYCWNCATQLEFLKKGAEMGAGFSEGGVIKGVYSSYSGTSFFLKKSPMA